MGSDENAVEGMRNESERVSRECVNDMDCWNISSMRVDNLV